MDSICEGPCSSSCWSIYHVAHGIIYCYVREQVQVVVEGLVQGQVLGLEMQKVGIVVKIGIEVESSASLSWNRDIEFVICQITVC